MADHKQAGLFSNNPCTFCRIIERRIPSFIVYEDGESLAFLDTRPLFPGHVLLVPKTNYQNLQDIPDGAAQALFGKARMLSNAVERAMGAEGSFIALNNKVSQSVPHVHIHIVPRRSKDGLKGFFWPRHKYNSDNEMQEVQKGIIEAIG